MMTKPSSAVDELATLRFRAFVPELGGMTMAVVVYRDAGDALPFADAARIITAQEQRIGELQRDKQPLLEWANHGADDSRWIPGKSIEESIVERVEQQEQRLGELGAALRTIWEWQDFPPTHQYDDNGAEYSYGFCYGSNGERDYMRKLAREALEKVSK